MSPNNLKEKVTDQYTNKVPNNILLFTKDSKISKEKEACKGIPGREITREGNKNFRKFMDQPDYNKKLYYNSEK